MNLIKKFLEVFYTMFNSNELNKNLGNKAFINHFSVFFSGQNHMFSETNIKKRKRGGIRERKREERGQGKNVPEANCGH